MSFLDVCDQDKMGPLLDKLTKLQQQWNSLCVSLYYTMLAKYYDSQNI